MNSNKLLQENFNTSLEVTDPFAPVVLEYIDYDTVVKDILTRQNTSVEVDREDNIFVEFDKDTEISAEIPLNVLRESIYKNFERDGDGRGKEKEKDNDGKGDNEKDREGKDGREIEIEGGVNKLLKFLNKNDIFNLSSNISELEIEVKGGKKSLDKLLKNGQFNKLLDKFGLQKDKIKRKLRRSEVKIERKITLLDGSTISLELEAEEGEFELSIEVERGDNYINPNTQDLKEDLQDISRRIARNIQIIEDEDRSKKEKRKAENRITRLKEERDPLLLEYVQNLREGELEIEPGDNPKINTILVRDEQLFYGTGVVAWNLDLVSDSVHQIGEDIRSKPENADIPANTTITTALGLGGSAAQGRVQPYPGDIDFSDTYQVRSTNATFAARAVANTIIEFVERNRDNPDFEFTNIVISLPKKEDGSISYSYQQLVDPDNYDVIVDLIKNLNPERGNINTFWRAIVDGENGRKRFIEISKILNITAQKNSSNELLFATKQTIDKELVNATSFSEQQDFFLTRVSGAEYQTAFIQEPEIIPDEKLSDYAITMRTSALQQFRKGKYLKAAKRSFNYLLSIGNIDGVQYVENSRIFTSRGARANQEVSVMEAIKSALNPENPATQILIVDEASIMLNNSANAIQNSFGTNPTRDIVSDLQTLSSNLPSNSNNNFLGQDESKSNKLGQIVGQTQRLINKSLQQPVTQLITTYIEPYYQGFDSLPNRIDEIDTIVAVNQTLNNNLPSEESLFNSDTIGFPLMNESSLVV